mgnify:CR=1 FL=1
MTKLEALKAFFGAEKPLLSKELIELRKDPKVYDELALAALTALTLKS